MGDNACIIIAFKTSRSIAVVLTFGEWGKIIYRYSGPDAEFNHLGTTLMAHGVVVPSLEHLKARLAATCLQASMTAC